MVKAFLQPKDIKEANTFLNEYTGQSKVVAGGTDMLVGIRSGKIDPEVLVDLSQLDELKFIELDGGMLRVGPMTTMSELVDSEVVRSELTALSQAARAMGAKQTRNRGTIGGNIASASAGADVLSCLMAFDTSLILAGLEGDREIGLDEFILGPDRIAIKQGEVICEIRIRVPGGNPDMLFKKLSRRNASSVSVLNMTCSILQNKVIIEDVRFSMGAVLPTARRMTDIEDLLRGNKPGRDLFHQAGQLALNHVIREAGVEALKNPEYGYEYKLKVLPQVVSVSLHQLCGMED